MSQRKVWAGALAIGVVVLLVVMVSRTGRTFVTRLPLSAVSKSEPMYAISKADLAVQLGQSLRKGKFPNQFDLKIEDENVPTKLSYGIDEASQAYMKKTIAQYAPDYSAFVAMDAKTGRILSLISYSRVQPDIENLAFKATFPAASIFKVITAGAAIDLDKAASETVVPFNGAYHTLYKRNVIENRENQWTRRMSMREAFGKSVNTFFGKLGLFYVGAEPLKKYAGRFLFNNEIHADVPVEMSAARISAEDPWSVVTAASGFTQNNTLSAVHGALIASAVANDGLMMEPFLVDTVTSTEGELLYRAIPKVASVSVDRETAAEMRKLFRQTVTAGTSKRSFKNTVRKSIFDEVEFGGKTGSLTGGDPHGKCDWFVGYAIYGDRRIAVAALTVNEKNWRVKSSLLASLFFSQYIKEQKQQELAGRN